MSCAFRQWLLLTTVAVGIAPTSALAQPKAFGILDNSFLVEEAFNQEKGVFQNIFSWTRSTTGEWESTFTQEWPVPTIRHQLSYTVPVAGGDGGSAAIGDVLINYRYQILSEGRGRPAFAPRLTAILPTGPDPDGSSRPGLQVNLPFSKQVGDLYVHWSAGLTWLEGVPGGSNGPTNLSSPQIAASLIWNTRSLFNLMIEGVAEFDEIPDPTLGTSRRQTVTISPGFRSGWNIGEKQIVAGAALPIAIGENGRTLAVLTYLSFELPFTANR